MPEQVLPFSTGVIMEPLPIERLIARITSRQLAGSTEDHWLQAAQAIMTTDTVPKGRVAPSRHRRNRRYV